MGSESTPVFCNILLLTSENARKLHLVWRKKRQFLLGIPFVGTQPNRKRTYFESATNYHFTLASEVLKEVPQTVPHTPDTCICRVHFSYLLIHFHPISETIVCSFVHLQNSLYSVLISKNISTRYSGIRNFYLFRCRTRQKSEKMNACL